MNAHPATILIVDDEAPNRRLFEMQLRHEGHLALSASSGEEALEAVAHVLPDLILLDVMMPGMDGYQVARALKADPVTSGIPIIMVTALTDRHARVEGLNAGAEEFLTKPIDRAELALRVRNLLRLKAYGDFMSDHARILEELVQSRTSDLQRFRTAMDASADGIFLVDRRSMRYVEINTTACTMLGYSREELLTVELEAVSLSDNAALEAIYDGLIAGKPPRTLSEMQVRRKDGSLLDVEVNRQAQRLGGEWIIVGVIRDITERKQAQDQILHLNTVLEERVRQRTAELQDANAELEAFSYSVSHDLRGPLSTISGFTTLLKKHMAAESTSEKSQRYLSRISASVTVMGDLIDALLALAQSGSFNMRLEQVDLSTMARHILDGYADRAPDRVVTLDIQPGLTALGDARMLRQVLDNLLGNAWKFTSRELLARIAFNREGDPGSEMTFAVRDNGAGFDMNHANKLFGAFQRMHSAAEFSGSGIGLATVQRIIRRHGGRVWAQSAVREGATFYFTLATDPDVEGSAVMAPAPMDITLKPIADNLVHAYTGAHEQPT